MPSPSETIAITVTKGDLKRVRRANLGLIISVCDEIGAGEV
jgi:hypothetical protein